MFARIRMFWIVATLVVVAAAGAFLAFANAPQLALRGIDVVLPSGAPVARDDVLAAAAIGATTNVVLLNTGAIRRRIEALPYVQTAELHRTLLPQPAVRIAVTVRVPYACVSGAGAVATIDATARVLQAGCLPGRLAVGLGALALPAPGERLADPDVAKLLADAATIEAQLPLRAIRRDRFGGIEVVDERGVTIRFGADDDLAAKLALVEPVRRAAAGRRLTAIDLRAPKTPVIGFP
jgi:cell division septal protein FtsQ